MTTRERVGAWLLWGFLGCASVFALCLLVEGVVGLAGR
jgi:hypothetical protein